MNLNSSVKMGGRFCLSVVEAQTDKRITQTGWVSNTILDTANDYLFTGFQGEKPLSIGSSTTATDPTQTTVLTPLNVSFISESVAPNSTVEIKRATDGVEEIHVTGSSVFRIKMLEDGVINEVAIDNFCRALIMDQDSGLAGLPTSTNDMIDIVYEFTMIYRVTRSNPLELEGTALTTDAVDHFADSSLIFLGSPVKLLPEGIYRWDSLLSTDNQFQLAENIHGVEREFDSSVAIPQDSVYEYILGDKVVRTAVFNSPGATLPAIRSFYFGNNAFGVNYVLLESVSNNSIGLVLDPTDKLSITTTIEWLRA